MRDHVGFGWSNITHALNPVNQVKMLYGVASNPLNPFKQTNAMLNLFRPGGGGTRNLMPTSAAAYASPQPWGTPPPPMSTGFQGYGPSAGPPPPWGAAAPPPQGLSYAPQLPPTSTQPWGGQPSPAASVPMYDADQYLAQTAPPMAADFGPNTGWDSAYGGQPGFGW